MRTVYLDQNKWIDLARAASGHPQGAPFVDVLTKVRAAVRDQRARFPLSCAHYFETGKATDQDRRLKLATMMLELSERTTIAPPHAIVPWELENALLDVFEIDHPRGELAIFGRGAAHAFATESLAYKAPATWDGRKLPKHITAELKRQIVPILELTLLARIAPPGVQAVDPEIWLNEMRQLTDDKFVAGQRDVRGRLDQIGRHRLRDVMLATAVTDIFDLLMAIAAKHGLTAEQLFDDPEVVRELIQRSPSRWVEMELRRVRQSNPQKDWEGHDLNDVTALSIAVPYCDIVVTERLWTGLINNAKVNQPFGTAVIRDLRDLPALLDPAAGSPQGPSSATASA